MIRRTDDRRLAVLAAIRTPKTVQEIALECGFSYMNTYYALQTLIDDRMCHVMGETADPNTSKSMDLYVFGSRPDPEREALITADQAIRTAVSLWVNSRVKLGPEDDDDEVDA